VDGRESALQVGAGPGIEAARIHPRWVNAHTAPRFYARYIAQSESWWIVSDYQSQTSASWARGISVFAGVMMIVGGGFQSLQALAAIVNDTYLVVLPNYIYSFDLTAWGWIHLLVGLGLIVIGICVLMAQSWAYIAGIVVASLAALINFVWLPYSPLWAILVISLDVLIIWALGSSRYQVKTA
jgi:hypothetical protein